MGADSTRSSLHGSACRLRRVSSIERAFLLGAATSIAACSHASESTPPKKVITETPVMPEAALIDVPPRDVTVHGKSVHLAAHAKLFYNLRPADQDARDKPIFILSNGFSARIVRGFGTGPTTVAEDGEVVDNPSSLTSLANLVYFDPRQSGFSYDVIDDRAPTKDDCGFDVFNEYVDAADMLIATLGVLEAHPELTGPVYWVGESYAGVRIQWQLSFLRNRWDLVPYDDPAVRSAISSLTSSKRTVASLMAGEILLEPWLLGKAHADAIAAACSDPSLESDVASAVGGSCNGQNACACADSHSRSRYNFNYDVTKQNAREYDAAAAHMEPDKAEKLLGVPLTSIAGLDAAHRSQGFKCDLPDSETPPQDSLEALFGALPAGQSYFLPYSPLQPGKELESAQPDWDYQSYVGAAFIDNISAVPTFVTHGHLDLVVPLSALIPGIAGLIGADNVAMESASRIRVNGPAAVGFIDIGDYPNAGHMITMLAADDLSRDVTAWLSQR